ncbi:hypothetical protein SeMB42_g05338 [Synchytrium endobioticum]|uniref:C3H1-type domain-containing protein n=1 Tax=Synchytrium endobioticum TaxID=286115 RepID=A0A507CSC6_9FUNG|nr:hypothetical protein SeLEV6574_g06883 [Synchytrium endobioticum]TPX41960.1 hypothetical protein SeMB42_g05338 [Synchytrium endobioticum]
MQLTDQETVALKAFLTADLVHRSEADPEVLADYVLVLLKHEQPLHELRKMFTNQLDDFLKEQTNPFVTRLFTVLQTKEYMGNNDVPAATTPPPPYVTEDDDDGERNFKHARNDPMVDDNTRKRMRDPTSEGTIPHHPEYEQPPPPKRPDLMDDRRRPGDTRPQIDVVERLGPPNFNARNGRPNNTPNSNFSPFNSNSNINRFAQPQQQPFRPNNFSSSFQQPHQPGAFSRNNGMVVNSINNRLGGVMASNRMMMPGVFPQSPIQQGQQNQNQPRRPYQKFQKCRDYEERGFCLRGDDCPFDHGPDKIILEDPMGAFAGSGPLPQPNMMQYVPRPSASVPAPFQNPYGTPVGMRSVGFGQPNGPDTPSSQPYNSSYQTPTSSMPIQPMQRPMTPGFSGDRNNMNKLGGGHEYGTPDNTTLVIDKIPADKQSLDAINAYFKKYGTILQLKLVPGTNRAVVQFSKHSEAMMAFQDSEPVFSNRFVRIFWMRPEDFSMVGVAPTFGNVMGHHQGRQGFVPRPNREPPIVSAAELLARPLTPASSGPSSSFTANITPSPSVPKPQITALKSQSTALMTKLMEEQKLVLGMMEKAKSDKDKAELKTMFDTISTKLAGLLEEGKAVATKAAITTSAMSPATNPKHLLEQKKKEALDRELEEIQRSASGQPPSSSTDVSAPDKNNSPSSSSSAAPDKTTPEEVLADLKAKAASLGIDTTANGATAGANNALAVAGALTPVGARGRGRGISLRGRGTPRGGGISRFNLDFRPRTLLVRGFENPNQETISAHFEQFGTIESIEIPSEDTVLIKYTTRKEAEIALAKGLKVSGSSTPLTMSWQQNTVASSPAPSLAAPAANNEAKDAEGEGATYGEADLLDDDDERHFKRS